MLTRQQKEIVIYRLEKALKEVESTQFVELGVIDAAVDAIQHAIKTLHEQETEKSGRVIKECQLCDRRAKARGLCRKHYHLSLYQAILDGKPIEDERLTTNGYIELRVTGAWGPLKHRVIIMLERKRVLNSDEVVMFLNDDRSDCRRENLIFGKRKALQGWKET